MATNDKAGAYLRTKVLTASPEQLRMMLLDGAARFARHGRDGLAARDFNVMFEGFSRARDILVELMTSLRPEIDPELCARVSALYAYLYRKLIEAAHEKDTAKADEVISLLDYECETWRLALDKINEERRAGPSKLDELRRRADADERAAPRAALNAQG